VLAGSEPSARSLVPSQQPTLYKCAPLLTTALPAFQTVSVCVLFVAAAIPAALIGLAAVKVPVDPGIAREAKPAGNVVPPDPSASKFWLYEPVKLDGAADALRARIAPAHPIVSRNRVALFMKFTSASRLREMAEGLANRILKIHALENLRFGNVWPKG
jgi:hypothetical protein